MSDGRIQTNQKINLKWQNHQITLTSGFDKLLENGTLSDCTLSADGKYVKAHKVVLAACSPYLASLLTEQYDKHPIIILKDVTYEELVALMEYIYRGEVNVTQDQLPALLAAGEYLQVKGLTSLSDEAPKKPIKRRSSASQKRTLASTPQKRKQQAATKMEKMVAVPKIEMATTGEEYTHWLQDINEPPDQDVYDEETHKVQTKKKPFSHPFTNGLYK